jgi:hypothetical protein
MFGHHALRLCHAIGSSHPVLGALNFSELLGFVQLFGQFGEAASVPDLGLLVEHLGCVAQANNMNACLS